MSITKVSRSLQGKKIAILGLGIENEAMLGWFFKHGLEAEITICDMRTAEQLGERYSKLSRKKNIAWRLGAEFNRRLYEFDLLFRAPGWTLRCPGIKEAKQKNKEIIVTSAMNLFLELCPTKNVIGVTGSKGKGTTSSLIFDVLKAGKKRVFLGGNIGIAPFAFLEKVKSDDYVVLELSSFQLEDMIRSPRIAVLTNLTKEHLQPADPNNPNYHKTMAEYWAAKANIFANKECQVLIANANLQSRIDASVMKPKKTVYFHKSDLQSGLPGEHNRENVAAAVEVARYFKLPQQAIEKAVKKFKGLEHRIEFVREYDGVRFYDDSFATTPDAAITAMKSFSGPISILLGGADKGSDFKQLAKEAKKRCGYVVLLEGEATPKISQALTNAGFDPKRMNVVSNIAEAVALVYAKASKPGTVLLSPACASFGMFRNYKERGDLFKREVNNLK